jgi:3-oxoacyl-[acyl-carrier-protein] synthase II
MERDVIRGDVSAGDPSAGNVITGIGAVSCLGRGQQALWRGIAEGRDGLRPIRRFSTEGFRVQLGGLVPEREASSASADVLCLEFATWAAREAWQESGWLEGELEPERIALVLGTSPSDRQLAAHELSERLGDELAVKGPRVTVSTACSSSTNALGIAADLLDAGMADVVLAGGADVLTPLLFAGFHALGVLCLDKCAPFSFPHGTSLGEGAGFVVLEPARARARRRVRARLLGYGLSCDAFHDTAPDPTGAGVARALVGALRHAALAPDRIGYVNAHGTGTSANDPAEWRALLRVFGERAQRLPVSSSKSMLGHAQAAAGVLELCATILALERGRLPQTLHFTRPRQHAPGDPVIGEPRVCACRYAVSTNSAFGGANAALVVAVPGLPAQVAAGLTEGVEAGFAQASEARSAGQVEPRARRLGERAVYVAGLGVLGSHGSSTLELARHLDDGVALATGALPERALDGVAWPADPHRLDPSTRYLLGATTLALADAGLRRLTGSLADRTGCIAGITRVSPQCIDEIERSIEARGLPRLSANAFSRMVLNAPLGSCAKVLALRGPASTVSIGPGSGLFAIVYAARWLATRRDTAFMLGAGLDEHGLSKPAADGMTPAPAGVDGAACLVLSAEAGSGHPRLSGCGIGGPGDFRSAVEGALAGAGVRIDDVDVCIGPACARVPARRRIEPATVFAASQSFSSAASLAVAAFWLRSGRARHALVVAGGGSATVAVLLSAAVFSADPAKPAAILPGASEEAACSASQ